MKQCSKCKEEKSREEFSNNCTKKDGLDSNCKVCKKTYREENKDKIKAYYEENKDKIAAYREENKDKIREREKAYREVNREVLNKVNKDYHEANKDKIRERKKAYREANIVEMRERDKVAYRANRIEIIKRKMQYHREHKCERNIRRNKRRIEDPLFAMGERIRRNIGGALQRKGYRKSSRTVEILGCSLDEFYLHIEQQFHSGMTWDNRSLWHLDHIVPVSFGVNEEEIIRLNHHSNFRPLWAEENMEKSDKLTEEALQHPIYHEILSRR